MKIQIKKIVRDLNLGDYDAQYEGLTLKVWVNPDRGTIAEREELQAEFETKTQEIRSNNALAEPFLKWVAEVYAPAILDWYARLWSQGEDAQTHWSVDEMKELDTQDPAMLEWMKRRSVQMAIQHRTQEKKG
jgi:hypothetical protein